VLIWGDSVKVGFCGGTVLRWAYVGGQWKGRFCGGQCKGELMWGTVLRRAYVGGQC